MSHALNDIQLEILKLFHHNQSEEDLKEIKSLLVAYLANKVVKDADNAVEEKNYPLSVFEKWKSEHFRRDS